MERLVPVLRLSSYASPAISYAYLQCFSCFAAVVPIFLRTFLAICYTTATECPVLRSRMMRPGAVHRPPLHRWVPKVQGALQKVQGSSESAQKVQGSAQKVQGAAQNKAQDADAQDAESSGSGSR
eukprot:3887238-Rhodomonas_salina.1